MLSLCLAWQDHLTVQLTQKNCVWCIMVGQPGKKHGFSRVHTGAKFLRASQQIYSLICLLKSTSKNGFEIGQTSRPTFADCKSINIWIETIERVCATKSGRNLFFIFMFGKKNNQLEEGGGAVIKPKSNCNMKIAPEQYLMYETLPRFSIY